MSFKAIQSVLENSKTSGNSRLVLIAIASHFGKNHTSWPSIERIAELSNCNTRTVKRSIKECTESGELIVRQQEGRHGVNVYSLSYYGGDKHDRGVTNRAKNMSQMSPLSGQTRHENGQTRHENGQIVQKSVVNVTRTYKNLKESREPIATINDGTDSECHHLPPFERALHHASRGKLPERNSIMWETIKRYNWRRLQNLTNDNLPFEKKPFEEIYYEESRRNR